MLNTDIKRVRHHGALALSDQCKATISFLHGAVYTHSLTRRAQSDVTFAPESPIEKFIDVCKGT